ncbi:MAG: F0F1 ATP synthase subunit C [Parachlamydiales bacterium]|jgi:F-type H+-transporting ATPase subunit c
MNSIDIIAMTSIITGGLTMCIGVVGPAIAEGISISKALQSVAQQPDESNTLVRTLFVGLAMIESLAIFCLVIAIVLIFTNPFWNYVIAHAGK